MVRSLNTAKVLLSYQGLPSVRTMPLLLEVELTTGKISNLTSGKAFTAKPYPEFMAELIAAGGLIEYTRERLANIGRARSL